MPWLVEVIEYVMYGGTFLAAPWVLRQGEHVRVDLSSRSVPKPVAICLEQVVDALGALVSLVMCIYGVELLIDAYRANFIEFKNLARARMGAAPANPDRLRDAGCRIHAAFFPRAGRRRRNRHRRSKCRAWRANAMAWYFALALMVGSICVLMTIGIPIAFAFFLTNIVGSFIFLGGQARHRRVHPRLHVGDREFQSGARSRSSC